jgi:hypothetical protein
MVRRADAREIRSRAAVMKSALGYLKATKSLNLPMARTAPRRVDATASLFSTITIMLGGVLYA